MCLQCHLSARNTELTQCLHLLFVDAEVLTMILACSSRPTSEDSDGCEPCPKGTYSNRFSDQWPLGCTFCPSTSYQDQEGASVVEQICLSSGSFPDRWARRHACHVQQIPSQFRRPFPWKTAAARRVTSHPFMMRAKHMASRVMLALRAIPKTSRSFAEASKFAGLQYSRLMGVCQLLNH